MFMYVVVSHGEEKALRLSLEVSGNTEDSAEVYREVR